VQITVSARDQGRCVQCGASEDLHFDHKIPWSRGGTNTVNNIQLLCGTCNRIKGAQWEGARGDKGVAEETVRFLEGELVLSAKPQIESELFWVQSANEISQFLTAEISTVRNKDLADSLRAMRAAAKEFVDAAGPDARNFADGWQPRNAFGLALGEFRTLMRVQIARIATQFDLLDEPPDEDDLD
jgi:hypothetical protein